MPASSRFEKEQALRKAGVLVTPYPTIGADTNRASQNLSDRALLDAGTAWEEEIDRLYAELIGRQATSADQALKSPEQSDTD